MVRVVLPDPHGLAAHGDSPVAVRFRVVDAPVVQVVVVPQVLFIDGYGRPCEHAATFGLAMKVPQIQFIAPSVDIPVVSCRRHLCRGAVSLGPENH